MTLTPELLAQIKEEIKNAPKTLMHEGSYGPVAYELCGISSPHLINDENMDKAFNAMEAYKVNTYFRYILDDKGWSKLLYKPFVDLKGNEKKPIAEKRKKWAKILDKYPFLSLEQEILK